jgi:hypothetical protein
MRTLILKLWLCHCAPHPFPSRAPHRHNAGYRPGRALTRCPPISPTGIYGKIHSSLCGRGSKLQVDGLRPQPAQNLTPAIPSNIIYNLQFNYVISYHCIAQRGKWKSFPSFSYICNILTYSYASLKKRQTFRWTMAL